MWLILLRLKNSISPCFQGKINQGFGRPLLTGANNRPVCCICERLDIKCSGAGTWKPLCTEKEIQVKLKGAEAPGFGRDEQEGR